MKKIKRIDGGCIVAEKIEKNGKKKLNYYIQTKDRNKYYAFTKNYSTECYEMCKGGIMASKLVEKKCKNIAVMRLINHLKRMWKYLIEYYEIESMV